MPMLGYLACLQFVTLIQAVDNIIPPLVLGIIGGNMIRGSLEKEETEYEENEGKLPAMPVMLGLTVATSIDAFAVGVTFIPLNILAMPTAIFIGCITFLCSSIGVKIGHVFGLKHKKKAEFIGGLVLIVIGQNIFIS